MKIISMSAWGNELMYWEGALANAQLYRSIYPGWKFRIYTDTENGFTRLMEKYDCEVRIMQNFGGIHGMYWRFLPASEEGIEAVIVRDSDSRLNLREAAAVDAWLKSGKAAHIMRDHPYHYHWPISGGMWGVRGGVIADMESKIATWGRWGRKFDDQYFLKSVIWPCIKSDCLQHVHGSSPWGGEAFPPHGRCDSDFVGQVYFQGGKKDAASAEYRANPDFNDRGLNQHVQIGRRGPFNGPDRLLSDCVKMLSALDDVSWMREMLTDDIDWTLFALCGEALRHLREHRLDEAAPLFHKALDRDPKNANVLRELSLLELNRREPAAALELITRAINLMPRNAIFLTDRGIVLRRLKRSDEALASYDCALAIAPNDVRALNCRGNVLSDLKQFNEAVGSYDCALAIEPNNAEVLKNRGIALRHADRQEEALASFDRALSIKPDHAEVLNLRGETLKHLGRFDEAFASYDRALAVNPHDTETLILLGDLLREAKRPNDALACYDRALLVDPDNSRALHHRAYALRELHRFDEALASCDRALLSKPSDASLLATRGIVLECQGRIGEAITSFRNALAARPEDAAIHTTLIFALNFDASTSAREQQEERSRWNSQHARRFRGQIQPHENARDPLRKLRIGYVSGHFKGHAAVYAFGGMLLHHDPEGFEVICYSDTVREDDITDRLRGRADAWRCTADLSDEQLAGLIRQDRIDILVDLVGHMGGNRLLAFARKPAPIQVTAWGEPTGTGLETMNYLFADPVLVPEEERGLLAEQVVDLPNFLGYWTPEALPESGPLPALRNGYVTFGSFNRLEKVTDITLRAWAAILHKLPQSRLVMKAPVLSDKSQQRRILDTFKSELDITAERLTLLGNSDRASHFAAYQQVDIALDTFPHSGGMTTLDALWMGVPVVAWRGHTISSRLAAACLAALRLTDFTADDVDCFVNLAVTKAADIEGLSRLRAALRRQIAASDFGDPARYARAVESAYRKMWQRWCSGLPDNER